VGRWNAKLNRTSPIAFFQFMGRLYKELGKKLTRDLNKQAAYYGNGCGHNYSSSSVIGVF
jgi:hypothetical protein